MRNLKKILALVLALVMSLSLMATAGASSFPDVDAENPYATAIEVLDELKVFQGYKEDGTFRPTETLNRAQAAVLVYRIATGDVEDKYLDNYTYMQQSKFNDLDGYNWAKGYINYCQNAGIVVGTSATTFDPGAKVTGYQLLVMLLRTLGYGKAGEFADPKGWELQTAAIAEREGITKNVTAGDFGAPAPRQMVAEILFRGLLTETVEYSALVPGGYTKSGETLGMREFGLEKVSGVVMANEWANLEGDSVAKADTTIMKVDEKNITVSKGTELDAVGLTYNAYIANGEGSTKRALTLEAGDNTVAFNEGKATSVSDQAKAESLKITGDTEYFVDYDQGWNEDCTSDYLIRYAIAKVSCTAEETKYIQSINGVDGHSVTERNVNVKWDVSGDGQVNDNDVVSCWVVSIKKNSPINTDDQAIMEKIFDSADRLNDAITDGSTAEDLRRYVFGEVYVGTTSLTDYSDTYSWRGFREEFLNDTKESRKFAGCENGESLRVVDNNGDGTAEYVLKITYTLDQAVGIYKEVLEYNGINTKDYDDIYSPDDLVVGDVVIWNVIDGKLSIWKADVLTDSVKTKNFKDNTITTVESDETKGQSGITNATTLDEIIMNMADKTEYNMYLDRFGFVRAYELAQGSKYALVTEIYPTNLNNGAYITNTDVTAEVKMGDADVANYRISNATSRNWSPFISDSVWTSSTMFHASLYNYLQPAIAHLGIEDQYEGATANKSYPVTAWARNVWAMVPQASTANYGVFDYGKIDNTYYGNDVLDAVDHSFSFTNVAAYTMDGDDVILNTASKLFITKEGEQVYYGPDGRGNDYGNKYTLSSWIEAYRKANPNSGLTDATLTNYFTDLVNGTNVYGQNAGLTKYYPVYAVDYVQLAKQDVKGGTRHFTIDPSYRDTYHTNSNGYVDATNDTEFYVVMPNGITYKTGYADLPTISAANIRAAYAVATNTSEASDNLDYWVADVIVLEVNGLSYGWDSVSLMYYNPYQTVNSVRYVNSLNNEWQALQPEFDGKAKMDVVPESTNGQNGASVTWGNHAWTRDAYGFYELYNTELETEGTLTATDVRKIVYGEYNDHGIYAGTVARMNKLIASGYIDIDTKGRADWNDAYNDEYVEHVDIRYSDYEVPVYRVYTNDASEIRLTQTNGDVRVGDEVIYVYNRALKQVSFIIDLGIRTKAADGFDYTPAVASSNYPSWLAAEYDLIVEEQLDDGGTQMDVNFGMIGDNDLEISDVTGNKGDVEFGKYRYDDTIGFNDEFLPDGSRNPAYHLGYFYYPEGTSLIRFTITANNAKQIASIVFQGGWEVTKVETVAANKLRVTIFNENNTKSVLSTDARANYIAAGEGENVIATLDYIQNRIIPVANTYVTAYNNLVAAGEAGAWGDVVFGDSTFGAQFSSYADAVLFMQGELESINADLTAYEAGAEVAENAAAEAALGTAILAVEIALGENAGQNAISELQAAWTAYQTEETEATTEALVAAIQAYEAAKDTMSGEQITAAAATLTAAKNAINELDDSFITAYDSWTSDKSWTNVSAANTAIPEAWEVEAFDTLNPVTAPATTLAAKVAEVKTAFAEAQKIKNAYDAVVTAANAYYDDTSPANTTALINAYDAAIALGMNNTEAAGNQPYDLLHTDAKWDTYVGGMTNGARLKGEAAVSLPELTSITMDPYKVAFYGMEVGEPSEAVDGVVTVEISMPAGMDPVEITDANDFGEWFGETGLQYVGASWSVSDTNEITITGKNTDKTLTVKLDWVDSGVNKYRAMMWGNTSICLALYNIGTGSWMSRSDIQSLGVDNGTSFGFSMNGRVMEFAYDSFGEQTTAGLWGDSSSATYGFVKYVPDSLGNNADLFTGDNAPKISADSMNKKLAGATVSFELVNNTDVDITFWSATIHMGG